MKDQHGRNNRLSKINEQKKIAAFRAKFGPSKRPAPVTVRTLNGEVVAVCDQSKFKKAA